MLLNMELLNVTSQSQVTGILSNMPSIPDPMNGLYSSLPWLNAWANGLSLKHKGFLVVVYKAGYIKNLLPITVYEEQLYLGAFTPFAAWSGEFFSQEEWFEIFYLLESIPEWKIAYAINCISSMDESLTKAGWTELKNTKSKIMSIDLPATTDEYTANLSANCRQTIRRKIKKSCIQDIQFKVLSGQGMEASIDQMIRMYEHRWGMTQKRKQIEFNILERFSQQDQLKIAMLTHENKPVAMVSSLYDQLVKSNHVYLTAYDASYEKYSPGLILHYLLIEWSINAGYHYYCFGFGDERYKSSLKASGRGIRSLYYIRNRVNIQDIPQPSCPMPAFL